MIVRIGFGVFRDNLRSKKRVKSSLLKPLGETACTGEEINVGKLI